MKKYLAVLLGVLFLFGVTATAFAIHEPAVPDVENAVVSQGPSKITLGGKMVLRGWYFDNINSSALPAKTGSQALYTTNVYLTVDAKIADNLQAFLELETASGTQGNQNSGVYYWGTYDSKPNADILIRQAWVQYVGSGLLGVPTGIKAGHFLVALGEKQFLDNTRFGNDGIILWVDPTKELHLALATTKLNEGATALGSMSNTDDLDGYFAILTYMWDKDNTVGANVTWAHTDGVIPSLKSDRQIEDEEGNLVTEKFANCDDMNFYNVGVHANGKIAGFSYALEGDWQFGKAKGLRTVDELGDIVDSGDADFKGWGVFAKVGYMLDPVNIRASFAMGSGNDGDDEGDIKEFQTLVGTDNTSAIARFTHYTLVYERMVRTAAAQGVMTTKLGGNIRTTGIANTTYVNLGVDVNPMKDLSVSLDGFWLKATDTGLWEAELSEDGDQRSVEDDIGWEIDVKANYKIAKNLSYFVEGGVLIAGDFYKDIAGAKKDAFTAIHGLLVTF